MQSRIARELKLRHQPVATIFANDRPEDALSFQPGTRGCVISMLTAASLEGRTAVFDRQTTGCPGGLAGLCFGDKGLKGIRGGFEYFLSTGRGEGYPEGEGYKQTPELARQFAAALSLHDLPQTYRSAWRKLKPRIPDPDAGR